MTKNNYIQVTSVDLMKYWNEVIKEKKPKMLPGWYDISFQILYNHACWAKVLNPVLSLEVIAKHKTDPKSTFVVLRGTSVDDFIYKNHPMFDLYFDINNIKEIASFDRGLIIDTEGCRVCIDSIKG